MNNRLQQFLELEQLTPARFADMMGVQRSNISHLLSGRNKPGYDFIQKFLNTFPNINAEWFLTGRGKPYKDSPSLPPRNQPIDPPTPKFEDNLFSQQKLEDLPDLHIEAEHQTRHESLPANEPPKNIRRITLFYSDGTFQEFFPPK